jgi:ribosome-binding ATPase
MGFQCGIVGLPNVGKSTLFNLLTHSVAQAANFPFCTIEPNIGRVPVPDDRLQVLTGIFKTQSTVPAFVDFVDIAGLVKGASKGEGLGNQFLGHIKEVQAIAHVVRCFDNPDIIHVEANINPIRDIQIIDTELILADLESVTKSLDKQKKVKFGDSLQPLKMTWLEAWFGWLNDFKPLRTFVAPTGDEAIEYHKFLQSLHLITAKPQMFIGNIEEKYVSNPMDSPLYAELVAYCQTIGCSVLPISAQLEYELSTMDPEEAAVYMGEYGLTESGVSALIKAGYGLLGLQTYFTAGVKEVRAWTIPLVCKAPEAAGKIHTDFAKGFIAAEVYNYADLQTHQDVKILKEKGLVRKEGKEYFAKDGDIMEFFFNV